MTIVDLALILAILALLLVHLCHNFSEPVCLSSYLLPALAIVCTAVSLGPAHSAEIAAGLALEYEIVNEDPELLAASRFVSYRGTAEVTELNTTRRQQSDQALER